MRGIFSVLNRFMNLKAKIALDEITQVRKILFKIVFIATEEKTRLKSELNSTETEDGGDL